MKEFKELTEEEKEKLIEEVVNNEIESLNFKDLYQIAYDVRKDYYFKNSEMLKESYEFLKCFEEIKK